MPTHEYSPKKALDLLKERIETESPDLSRRIKVAIDEGKEVMIREGNKLSKKTNREYRKMQPYTDEEALIVALKVLKAHLVETRLFAISAHNEFTKVGITNTKPGSRIANKQSRNNFDSVSQVKTIEIETEPETVQSKSQADNAILEQVDESKLDDLREIFTKLENLICFKEKDIGNSD